MSTARLGARIKYTKVLGTAVLEGHTLRFHKHSRADGTAKCDAFRTGSVKDMVIGVLYEVPERERLALDRFEGAGMGYDVVEVDMRRPDGRGIRAFTYLASTDAIDQSLRPTEEYRRYVEIGALEHDLPKDYIEAFILSAATL